MKILKDILWTLMLILSILLLVTIEDGFLLLRWLFYFSSMFMFLTRTRIGYKIILFFERK